MLGISSSLVKGGASLLTYVKDNLKLYLDFKSKRSDTLAFPSEGSTSFVAGSSQYISIGDNNTLDLGTGDFSVSFWYKTSTLDKTFLAKKSTLSGTDAGFNFYIEDATPDVLRWGIANGSTRVAVSHNTEYSADTWQHGCGVREGDNMYIYLNGVVGTTVGTGVNALNVDNSLPLEFGRSNDGNYSSVSLSNVGIWSRALSAEEINSVMNKNYSQLGSVEKTSLVSWWALDSKAPTTVTSGTAPRSTVFLDSVSSTLGSAVVDTSNFSGWSYDGSSSADGNNHISFPDGGDNYAYTSGVLSTSTVYYFTVTADVSGTFYLGENDGVGSVANIGTGTTTGYFFTDSSLGLAPIVRGSAIGTISHIAVYPVTGGNQGMNIGSSVGNEGAITTTSVYGGNAPVLPRAIDITESQADAIGNGSALFVKSNSDYINLGSSLDFNVGASDFTISCWINPNNKSNDAGWDGIVYLGSAASSQGHLGFNPSGNLALGTGGSGNWQTVQSSTTVDLNTWTHIAGTREGDTLNIYKNGIKVYTASHSYTPSTLDEDCFIGRGGGATESYDGYIAQVGIWRGALTQAQMQSLMESTSYSKIPADVKSTLGSELITNGTFDSNITGWSNYISSRGDVTFSNNRLRIDNSTGTGNTVARISASFSSGKTYKVSFDYYHISGATGTTTNVFLGAADQVIPSITSGQTTTAYITATSNRSTFEIGYNGGEVYEFDNISVKEVTNDIVAYYPLDADSSANGVTQDVITGETLGSEEITKSVTDSWTGNDVSVNEASSEQAYSGTQSLKFTTGTGGGAKGVTSNTFTSIQNALYKLDFWVYSPSSEDIDVFAFQGGGAGSSFVETITIATNQWVNVVRYYNEVAGGASSALKFANNTNSVTAYVDNISLKRVTSNTGVLK